MRAKIGILFGVLICSPLAFAQDVRLAQVQDAPVKLANGILDSEKHVHAQATVVSTKPIATMIFRVSYIGSSGTAIFQHSMDVTKSLSPDIRGWSEGDVSDLEASPAAIKTKLFAVTPTTIALAPDLIVYQDGTTWGPDTLKMSQRIFDERKGAAMQDKLRGRNKFTGLHTCATSLLEKICLLQNRVG